MDGVHRIAVASVALIAVAATGCHPSGGHRGAAPDEGVAAARAAALHTAAGNRVATSAEARRLLGLTPLPAGAVPTAQRPAATDQPAVGTPATASLVDHDSYWFVAQPVDSVWRYVQRHRPAGLQGRSEAHGGTVAGGTSQGLGWSEPDRDYATNLMLDISLARSADGRGTVLRADGVGVWLDPEAVRDTAAGPRMRVVVQAGCPHTDRGMAGVESTGAAVSTRLLPDARPTRALICEYGGLNTTPPFALVRSARLGKADAGRLAQAYLRLRIAHPDQEETSCPMDDGSIDVISFGYVDHADVDLWATANGCGAVSNGVIVVAGRVAYRGSGATRR